MPHGGARVGAGRKPSKSKLPVAVEGASPPADGGGSRPTFTSATEFGLWCLNAPDTEVTMDQKIRAMQTVAAIEMKRAEPVKADAKADAVKAMSGDWAPRRVKGFGVVDGGK